MGDETARRPRATRVDDDGARGAALDDVATLDYEGRRRRRVGMTADGGLAFVLDLPETRLLRDGDVLALDDGRRVGVRAAVEPVAEIAIEGADAMTRLAWHLGNRHTPTEILADRLRIRRDHVLEAMATGLGATVTHAQAPFSPESGAYSGHGGRRHHHGDDA